MRKKIAILLQPKKAAAEEGAGTRNGVPLFQPVAGAPAPSLALVNRLRDELA